MLLDKALLCSSMSTNFAPDKRTASIVNTLPAKPSFVLRYSSMTRTCTAIWLGSNKTVKVHPMITMTFGWKWGDIIGRDITALPCYMEYCSPDGISIALTQIITMKVHGTIGDSSALSSRTEQNQLISFHAKFCSFT
jgi:hypothetical protein